MQFDHIGIVTTEKKADEMFVPATRVWVTDFQTHPQHIEWLRFEPDSPVTGKVRDAPCRLPRGQHSGSGQGHESGKAGARMRQCASYDIRGRRTVACNSR